MRPTQSVGKRVRGQRGHWLGEKAARDFQTNHKVKESKNNKKANFFRYSSEKKVSLDNQDYNQGGSDSFRNILKNFNYCSSLTENIYESGSPLLRVLSQSSWLSVPGMF